MYLFIAYEKILCLNTPLHLNGCHWSSRQYDGVVRAITGWAKLEKLTKQMMCSHVLVSLSPLRLHLLSLCLLKECTKEPIKEGINSVIGLHGNPQTNWVRWKCRMLVYLTCVTSNFKCYRFWHKPQPMSMFGLGLFLFVWQLADGLSFLRNLFATIIL